MTTEDLAPNGTSSADSAPPAGPPLPAAPGDGAPGNGARRRTTNVVVVGAGLAGLAAARQLAHSGVQTVVLDGMRPGGRARSDLHDEVLLNRGPHALYRGGAAERVLGELGIRPTGGPPSAVSYGVLRGRVDRIPADVRTALTSRLIGWRAKAAVASALRRLPAARPADLAGVTVADWIDGLGLPADAASLMGMLARVATYGNAPQIMSAEVAVQQVQMALSHGVRYLDGGWQSLVDALANGLDVRRAQVVAVEGSSGGCAVTTADGGQIEADAVIVASGTPRAAAAVLGRAPFEVGPAIEAACLDLGVRGAARCPVLFGVDEPLYLSTHQPPARLAPPGVVVVCVARYLSPCDASSPAVQRAELDEHARLAGVDATALIASRYLHRMTVVGAMATAAGGGLAGRVAVTGSGAPNVFLAGDWVGPEGHLADAALASATSAARLAAARVRTRA